VRSFKSIVSSFLVAITVTLPAGAQSVPPQPSPQEASSPQASPSPQTGASPKPESSSQEKSAEHDKSAQQGQPAPARTSPVSTRFLSYQFVSGRNIAYHLEYQSISKADLHALFEGQNTGQAPSSGLTYALTATLKGEMEITTTYAGGDRVENFYVVRDPVARLIVNGNDQTAQANEVSATLAQGFLVELNQEGKVTALYLPPQAGKFSQDFVRTLLATLQFVLPTESQVGPGTWTTTEADRNGPYVARYRFIGIASSDAELIIHKNKLRYLPASAAMTGENLPGKSDARKKVTPKMDFEAYFNFTTGQLTSLIGHEVLDTAVEDKDVAHSETRLRLTQVGAAKASAAEKDTLLKTAAWLKENSSRLAVFAVRSRSEIEANIQRTELGTATLADLMAQLNSLKADPANPDKQMAAETPVYLKFKALIYIRPESCAQLGQVLAQANASSPAFRILSAALGAVGHRQAQAALVRAISARSQDSSTLPSLIATLGGAPHPSTESEKALRDLAFNAPDPNVRGAAILGLGSMARSLDASEPGRSSAIIDFLLERATAAGPSEQRQASLQALGNSASSRALPVLAKLATVGSPAVRAAAMDALRNIPRPQVDPLLRKTLSSDGDPQVRLEAAFALGFRKTSLESFNTQKKVLATESDEKVRGALLDNLAKMHRQYPEVRAILARAAKEDASEYVRKEAAGLLGRLQLASPGHK